MSENEINKGKIYVAYITTLGIPELTYALAYVVDEASASGVKEVAQHTSSNIDWAKQDIRHVYNLEKFKELFPQGYEMIDLDEIKIHCRVGFDPCADLAIDEVRKAAGLKDLTPHREEKKEMRTHAEIIDWMRKSSTGPQELADILEAAHKREKAEWVNANAGLAKLVDIEKVGDCAKLRAALKLCIDELCDRCRDLASARGNPPPCLNGCEPVRKAKAALAAPPRNCDLHTADELKVIFKSELVSELPIANEHEKNLVTITTNGVIDTLFATTKKGGNNANE